MGSVVCELYEPGWWWSFLLLSKATCAATLQSYLPMTKKSTIKHRIQSNPNEQDPTERLGQRKGVGEIKRHPFFGSVHWALIANSTPPFVLSGPDTPGWLASMRSAPNAGARDDKFATWTWMVCFSVQQPPPGVFLFALLCFF